MARETESTVEEGLTQRGWEMRSTETGSSFMKELVEMGHSTISMATAPANETKFFNREERRKERRFIAGARKRERREKTRANVREYFSWMSK